MLQDKLPHGSKARLLLCMYNLGMAPLRADCNRIALLSCCSETNLLDADVQSVAEENFLVLPKQPCCTYVSTRQVHNGAYTSVLCIPSLLRFRLLSCKSHANGCFKAKATSLTPLSSFQKG